MINWGAVEKVPSISDIEKQQKIDAAKQYLRDTDHHVITMVETGEPVRKEITDARAAARLLISSK